ncbi:hypothetical protein ELUCI_v1c05830 [Williamsoniiplasma lucivorax]|uniref:Uncharacterized protein n=1 Tax=Williamsoniiplasma lucivorax TaxID=209274 RepID=A0A2S5RDV3_9MOLU|nr:hypothetical protein ELUCI_v1c05830 [Williamsoniiplasma lucivorax]
MELRFNILSIIIFNIEEQKIPIKNHYILLFLRIFLYSKVKVKSRWLTFLYL